MKKMLFAYTGPLKDIDLAIHHESKRLETLEDDILEGKYKGADPDLRKKLAALKEAEPYIFYKERVGSEDVKYIRDGEIEPTLKDIWAYGIVRQDKLDLNDPSIVMIASNYNLDSLKIFADGYKEVKGI